MIFKYEIVEALNSLGMDMAEIAGRVHYLEERVTELESKKSVGKTKKKAETTAKRGPGRPRKK